MKPVMLLTLAICGVLTQGNHIERIQECNAHCAEGIHCKAKPHMSFAFCESPRKRLISSAIHSVNISTVMKCEKTKRCSLHLSVTSLIQISEHLRGITVCAASVGMLRSCRDVVFPRGTREKLDGQKVAVNHGCFNMRPDQQVHVTLRTIPSYCNLTWSQVYNVPGCHNNDLRENVPECITGKISYNVDEERRRLLVSVSGMLEDRDYHLRLCHKAFVCTATEEHVLLPKDSPHKIATFQYSKALPCLCIEGWSSMVDAPRTQVCPFINRTDELWHGLTFDHEVEALSWEPACSVNVVVTLCQMAGEHLCHNLVNSRQEVHKKKKVVYSKVDAHPRLCVKFSTDLGDWIKCPFLKGIFPVWDLTLQWGAGHPQAVLTSQINANLSLSLCRNTKNTTCDNIALVSMEKAKSVAINLTADVCRPDVCVQVTRTDVDFSSQVLLCDLQCSDGHPTRKKSDHEELFWTLLLTAIYLTVVVLVLFTGYVTLKIFTKKQ
ncbi:putative interleukin-17 receptor E-like isoform X1 [Scleropages formosus]|uniref:putative interleukin-17 receptor E-like isoform X1 n=1 Tax=Scleropages formosus TaxID=113540 RepID=UPI0010FA9685|nr:putative interleukin-17 receptor E-like isoform X1 [Scleropages formosus]XP_018585347.2 putative interleukin-17 receptor E-like isoform X1 [Scleropages formosus]